MRSTAFALASDFGPPAKLAVVELNENETALSAAKLWPVELVWTGTGTFETVGCQSGAFVVGVVIGSFGGTTMGEPAPASLELKAGCAFPCLLDGDPAVLTPEYPLQPTPVERLRDCPVEPATAVGRPSPVVLPCCG
jgi:hypothetical protein